MTPLSNPTESLAVVSSVPAGELLTRLTREQQLSLAEDISRACAVKASDLHITTKFVCLRLPQANAGVFKEVSHAIERIASANTPGVFTHYLPCPLHEDAAAVIWVEQVVAFENLRSGNDLANIPVVATGQLFSKITSRGRIAEYCDVAPTHISLVPELMCTAAVAQMTGDPNQYPHEVIVDVSLSAFGKQSSQVTIPEAFLLHNCQYTIEPRSDAFVRTHSDIANGTHNPNFQFNGVDGCSICDLMNQYTLYIPQSIRDESVDLGDAVFRGFSSGRATYTYRAPRQMEGLNHKAVMFDVDDRACADDALERGVTTHGDESMTVTIPAYMIYDNYRAYVADVVLCTHHPSPKMWSGEESIEFVRIRQIRFYPEQLATTSIEYSMSDFNAIHDTLFWDVVDALVNHPETLGFEGLPLEPDLTIAVDCVGACGTPLRAAGDSSLVLQSVRVGTRLSEYYQHFANNAKQQK